MNDDGRVLLWHGLVMVVGCVVLSSGDSRVLNW